MKTPNSDRPWLNSGKFPLSFSLTFILVAVFFLCGAATPAQEIATVIATGNNTAVTLKPRVRLERVEIDRNGAIKWFYVAVNLNAADDSVVTADTNFITISRPVTTFVADSQTIGGNTLTGQQLLNFLNGKFGAAYYAADHP